VSSAMPAVTLTFIALFYIIIPLVAGN